MNKQITIAVIAVVIIASFLLGYYIKGGSASSKIPFSVLTKYEELEEPYKIADIRYCIKDDKKFM